MACCLCMRCGRFIHEDRVARPIERVCFYASCPRAPPRKLLCWRPGFLYSRHVWFGGSFLPPPCCVSSFDTQICLSSHVPNSCVLPNVRALQLQRMTIHKHGLTRALSTCSRSSLLFPFFFFWLGGGGYMIVRLLQHLSK